MKRKLFLSAIALLSFMTSFSANILSNGGFESNLANWYVVKPYTGAVVSVDNVVASTGTNSVKILVNTTPTQLDSSALTSFFTFHKNATYKVRFKAKASSATTLTLVLKDYFANENVLQNTASLTTSFQQFEYTTTDPIVVSNHNGVLMFSYALVANGTTVWIDDVELSVLGGVDFYNAIANGDFDEASQNPRDIGWWLGSNDAVVSFDTTSKLSGPYSLLLTRNNTVGVWSDLQIHPWLTLQQGNAYKISFKAVGSVPSMRVGVFLDHLTPLWNGYNGFSTISTSQNTYTHYTDAWQVESNFSNPTILRFIDFTVGQTWLDDMRVVPYSVNLSSSTISSNSPISTLVGQLLPLTDEPGITYTLSLPDMSADATYSNNLFSVDGINLRSNASLSAGEKKIKLGITDSNLGYLTKDINVTVTDVATSSALFRVNKIEVKALQLSHEISVLNASGSFIKIFDILGKQVYSGKLVDDSERLKIPNPTSAIYVVSVEKDGKREIFKIAL